MTPHYEIEVREHEPDFAGAWRPVRVFRAGGVAAPLAFESLEEAQVYVAEAAGEARVVLVTDGGGRQVVGPVTA